MQSIDDRIRSAVQYLRGRTDAKPTVGLILGSGLGAFCEDLEDPVTVPFDDIPDFPKATVAGHRGAFVFGRFAGKEAVVLQGRVHYYEGYTQQEITIPVRVMKLLGVETLILTNAAGGINLRYSVPALMLIADHINYSGANPLIGPNLEGFGPRFPDMSDLYDGELRAAIKSLALSHAIPLEEGVYAMYSGPSFETPAEIRFLRTIGADAVGMSTVPEAIVAHHCGMRVAAISCITNMAAGVLPEKLDHETILAASSEIRGPFGMLIRLIVEHCG